MFLVKPFIQMLIMDIFAICLLRLFFHRQFKRGENLWLKILLVLSALYFADFFYIMLRPTYFNHRFMFSTERLNLVPFKALIGWKANPLNIISDVFLFVPLGYFASVLHPERTKGEQLARCFFGTIVLSLVIEGTQLWTFRVPDIDDVLLNAVGGLLGGLIYQGLKALRFDETIIGHYLMPRIPKKWHGRVRLQHYCFVLLMSISVWLFSVNYILTIPKTDDYVLYDQKISLEAQHVVVYDEKENDIIYQQQSTTPIYPASTQKMMIALTAADYVSMEKSITLGNEVYMPPLDASKAGLAPGMTLSVHDLFEALLLPSGADAAYCLSVYTGRLIAHDAKLSEEKAVARFVKAVNQKMQKIGAVHTVVKNVTGYDADGQMTTAEDLSIIARTFLKNAKLAEICAKANDTLSVGKHQTLFVSNTNKLLQEKNAYYNKDVAGIKTGTTSKAGGCLISVFTIKHKQYICVVMNSSYDGRFLDTQKIYQCVKNHEVPSS